MLSRALLLAGRLASAASSQPSVCTASRTVQSLSALLQQCSFATNSTDIFNVHKDTPENNASITFDLTEARTSP